MVGLAMTQPRDAIVDRHSAIARNPTAVDARSRQFLELRFHKLQPCYGLRRDLLRTGFCQISFYDHLFGQSDRGLRVFVLADDMLNMGQAMTGAILNAPPLPFTGPLDFGPHHSVDL